MTTVAIVDYGLGNLFSIRNACENVALPTIVTSDRSRILDANGLILPGVGAFGDAMASLQERGLVDVIREFAASGRPLLGICLGMQLLMSESYEFGHHTGLNLIHGKVVHLPSRRSNGSDIKVPKVGWSSISPVSDALSRRSFAGTFLEPINDGEYMYFVHSYHCVPVDQSTVVATSMHGDYPFACAVQKERVYGCQFHPEKSGPRGLKIYQSFAAAVAQASPHGHVLGARCAA